MRRRQDECHDELRPLPDRSDRHPGTDALRALVLTLVTVLVGLTMTAAVPDDVWAELSTPVSYDVPDWHGNVVTHGPHD